MRLITRVYGIPGRSDKEEFSGVSFHKLPSDNTRRHQWLISINLLQYHPIPTYAVYTLRTVK